MPRLLRLEGLSLFAVRARTAWGITCTDFLRNRRPKALYTEPLLLFKFVYRELVRPTRLPNRDELEKAVLVGFGDEQMKGCHLRDHHSGMQSCSSKY